MVACHVRGPDTLMEFAERHGVEAVLNARNKNKVCHFNGKTVSSRNENCRCSVLFSLPPIAQLLVVVAFEFFRKKSYAAKAKTVPLPVLLYFIFFFCFFFGTSNSHQILSMILPQLRDQTYTLIMK